MRQKTALVLMTIVAVISDSLLHPFYPQYFTAVLGVTDPQHVGLYIAACSATVMAAFPLWALLAHRVAVLHLLIGTQIATAVLSLSCLLLTSVVPFWVVSLVMMVFKASYLLIYPYLLTLEDESEHLGTISLLALVVYFGNILAALLSGLVFQLSDPRMLFVGMAVGDVLQTLLCLYMLRRQPLAASAPQASGGAPPVAFLLKLGLVMVVLYFSAYLTEPFFAQYWEGIAASDNRILSGAVFALPGIAALLGLYYNARTPRRGGFAGIVTPLILGLGGLSLEWTAWPALVLAGRFVSGWALFQIMVRLDLLLFRLSQPDRYAFDFSRINAAQALGVQLASLAAGALVHLAGPRLPIAAAALGLLAGGVLYVAVFRDELRAERTATTGSPDVAGTTGTLTPSPGAS